jgi:3-phosphoshikimate 1-carboxyvinyltransferase
MIYEIKAPCSFDGSVVLPASKSISNRLLIIQALAKNEGATNNLSDCDDTNVMHDAFSNNPYLIDIKAAGTAMRFLTAYLSLSEGETHVITGTERMRNRPISILVNALRALGADITYQEKDGYPPLLIKGCKMNGGKLELPGNVSSQYISALLMIAPYLPGGLLLELTGTIVSRPYINLTINLMKDCGADVQWIDDHTLKVNKCHYNTQSITVENDWSASSYWYEIAALSNKARIELPGLLANSYQGDSAIKDFFTQLGITTKYTPSGILIEKEKTIDMNELHLDFVNQPDLAQTLVVTTALMNIPFHFTGLQSLKIKETDRIAALINEMRKIGYVIKEKEEGSLCWENERCEATNEAILTYQDHRMAMAFAPASLKIGSIRIDSPLVVSKSYPHYWEELKRQNFIIGEI